MIELYSPLCLTPNRKWIEILMQEEIFSQISNGRGSSPQKLVGGIGIG